MAIKIRNGLDTDFDHNKLIPGELAITQGGKMYFCYSPGSVKQLATSNDLQEMLDTSDTAYAALTQLIADMEANPSELTNILANISALQSGKLDKTGDSYQNTVTFTQAAADADILTGDTHATLFGKIKKRFSILATSKADQTALNTTNITVATKADQTALNTTNTTVATKADKTVISDEYSASATYGVGAYCIYNNILYRCTTAITTPEAWTASHWTATKVATEVKTLNDNLTVSSGSGIINAVVATGYANYYVKNGWCTVLIALTLVPGWGGISASAISGLPVAAIKTSSKVGNWSGTISSGLSLIMDGSSTGIAIEGGAANILYHMSFIYPVAN